MISLELVRQREELAAERDSAGSNSSKLYLFCRNDDNDGSRVDKREIEVDVATAIQDGDNGGRGMGGGKTRVCRVDDGKTSQIGTVCVSRA